MVIKNVSFINSETKTILTCDIVIKDGRIASFATPNTAVDEDGEYIDATGLYAAPGFIDIHSHFRDPGFTEKEDIITGAFAA